MTPYLFRRRCCGAALALGAIAVGIAGPPAAATAQPGPVPPAAPAATTRTAALAAGVAARSVRLPTGDVVIANGGVVSGAARVGGSFVHVQAGGHQYEFPAAALRLVGRGLDPSLFDVTALARVESDDRIPVTLTGVSGATAPGVNVAGVHLGSSIGRGGVRRGYLTRGGQRLFAASLAAGRSPLPAGTAMSLETGTPAATPVRRFTEHVLTVHSTDSRGHPDNSDVVFVFDVDDAARLGINTFAVAPLVHGEAKLTVPEGHFAAVEVFIDTTGSGAEKALREVDQPQFTVTGDRSLTLDAAQASSRISIATPRPALAQETGFVFRRTDVKARSFYYDLTSEPGVPVYVAPRPRRVTVGGLQDYAYQRLSSAPAPGLPYEYDLMETPATGLIPAQHYRQNALGLARVDARYYSDVSSLGVRQLTGVRPFETDEFVLRPAPVIELPLHRIEYRTAGSVLWNAALATQTLTDSSGFRQWFEPQYGAEHRYAGGASVREDVNRYPLHTAAANDYANPATYYPVFPGADRHGDTVGFSLFPMSDNSPLDIGGLDPAPGGSSGGSWQFSADGKVTTGTLQGYYAFGDTFTVPAAAATLTLTVDAKEAGPQHPLSTEDRTTWTWRSSHQDTGKVRTGMACNSTDAGAGQRQCRVEPLLTVEYTVHGQRLDGSTAGGPQRVDLDFAHLRYAESSAVTGAAADYSTDGGTTWTAATVTGTAGHYSAAFPTPPAGGYIDLRVHATDAAGGSLTDTITRAFRANAQES